MKVVGLGGGSASGKSTVCDLLTARLGDRCQVVAHDWYYRTMPDAWRGRPTEYNFDHPDALDTDRLVADLDRLRAGESVLAPDYDFGLHVRRLRSDWRPVVPRPIVLVEGILVLAAPALRERMDLSVFVHTPEPVRLARRIGRDVRYRGRTEAEVRDQFARTVKPMHDAYVEPCQDHAGLVLDGTRPPEELVAKVLEHMLAE